VAFTDELKLRAMDWPAWCLLTHAKKKEFGDDTSSDSGTHPSRETIKRGVLHSPQPVSYGL